MNTDNATFQDTTESRVIGYTTTQVQLLDRIAELDASIADLKAQFGHTTRFLTDKSLSDRISERRRVAQLFKLSLSRKTV